VVLIVAGPEFAKELKAVKKGNKKKFMMASASGKFVNEIVRDSMH
jgi:hypothetical protein